MPYGDVNGLHLYSEEQGSGPPLVPLNGASGAPDGEPRGGWGTPRRPLAQRFRVVQVEHRGHGRTGNPGGADAHTPPPPAAGTAAPVAHPGSAPAHVAGFSLGGLVGLELALARPGVVRSVVGVGAGYTPAAETLATRRGSDPERTERNDPTRAADPAARHDPHHGPGGWRVVVRRDRAARAAARGYAADDRGRIAAPTLWIAGEHDPFFELDRLLTMKRRIPGAELLLVDHAGPFVQLTHPHPVGPAAVDFLIRSDERRPR
jgi:pimeloyl-ACP methyl ester carboxylesterase